MKLNNYHMAFIKAINLPILAKVTAENAQGVRLRYYPEFKQFDPNDDMPALKTLIQAILFEVRGVPSDIVDIFCDYVVAEVGDYYLPICPHMLVRIGGKSAPFYTTVDSGTTGNKLSVNLQYDYNLIDRSGKEVDSSDEIIGSDNATFTENVDVNSARVYIYGGVKDFTTQLVDILLKFFPPQATNILSAIDNVPTVNEQFIDESTSTPNLKTTTENKFDVLTTQTENLSRQIDTTQTGTQTVTTKRASNASAAEQIEIVRNLPNIFVQCAFAIKSLLISPQAIHDTFEWGVYGLNDFYDMESD